MSAGMPVEILAFLDNKKRSIGAKRDALVQMANGKYLTFVDDDDSVFPEYFEQIMAVTKKDVDVIAFNHMMTINEDKPFIIDCSINHKSQEVNKVNGKWIDIKRKPTHLCVWRSGLAKQHRFPNHSCGEDWEWCMKLHPHVKTEYKIDAVLNHYRWNEKISEACGALEKREKEAR